MSPRVTNLVEDAFFIFCEGPPTIEGCDAFLAKVAEMIRRIGYGTDEESIRRPPTRAQAGGAGA